MKFTTASLVFAIFAYCSPLISHAVPTLILEPTSDGSLYTCDGCNVVSDGDYVLVSGDIQGAIKFSSALITGTVAQAFLTVNPYGLPLFGPTVDVYGYGTTIGQLDVSDVNAGTFLGTLVVPPNLGFGEDAFFDVTAFVTTISAPFLAFNLRSAEIDVFSSLEFNYGHPSQLLLTFAVPEPSLAALLLMATLAYCGIPRRRLISHIS
jgi:hypothetical protein